MRKIWLGKNFQSCDVHLCLSVILIFITQLTGLWKNWMKLVIWSLCQWLMTEVSLVKCHSDGCHWTDDQSTFVQAILGGKVWTLYKIWCECLFVIQWLFIWYTYAWRRGMVWFIYFSGLSFFSNKSCYFLHAVTSISSLNGSPWKC